MRLSAQFANAAELRAWLAAGNKADAAPLDRSLPDADGLDLVSEIRDTGIKVIMLTIADTDEEISEAIASGVDGYVIKSSEPTRSLPPSVAYAKGKAVSRSTSCKKWRAANCTATRSLPLTAREMEIVEHVKEGLSNKVIAYKLSLSENTVRNHLRNIMEKLGLRNRVQVATLALKEDRKRH